MRSCIKNVNPATGKIGYDNHAERCPTAAWDMQAFWYNVTKAGDLKYGPEVGGNFVQIQRNGNGAV